MDLNFGAGPWQSLQDTEPWKECANGRLRLLASGARLVRTSTVFPSAAGKFEAAWQRTQAPASVEPWWHARQSSSVRTFNTPWPPAGMWHDVHCTPRCTPCENPRPSSGGGACVGPPDGSCGAATAPHDRVAGPDVNAKATMPATSNGALRPGTGANSRRPRAATCLRRPCLTSFRLRPMRNGPLAVHVLPPEIPRCPAGRGSAPTRRLRSAPASGCMNLVRRMAKELAALGRRARAQWATAIPAGVRRKSSAHAPNPYDAGGGSAIFRPSVRLTPGDFLAPLALPLGLSAPTCRLARHQIPSRDALEPHRDMLPLTSGTGGTVAACGRRAGTDSAATDESDPRGIPGRRDR
jgi:hypothetical protein